MTCTGEAIQPSVAEGYVNRPCCRPTCVKCVNATVIDLMRMICILCVLALLSACGEPAYEHAGSPYRGNTRLAAI